MFAAMRRFVLSLVIVASTLSMPIEKACAQGTNPPVVAPVPSNVVKQSRPYYVEGAVVVLLMAAAVFAVVRSSRRV